LPSSLRLQSYGAGSVQGVLTNTTSSRSPLALRSPRPASPRAGR
jgi:hypothetical protein